MTRFTLLRTSVAALGAAAVLAQTAAAAGEPKNEWPFTRPVATRTTQSSLHQAQANPPIQGEPKNELPFTRPVTVVVSSGGSGAGFGWIDGAIGGAAGFGLAIAGAGVLLALRGRSPRTA